MLQPTGPQEGAAKPASPPPPVRTAAVQDMTRLTLGVWQVGQATSASSDRRMTSASKVLSQAGQAYS